ncbi:hypothetical protein SRHO_G00187730 [Serrasalmus rhombeus]
MKFTNIGPHTILMFHTDLAHILSLSSFHFQTCIKSISPEFDIEIKYCTSLKRKKQKWEVNKLHNLFNLHQSLISLGEKCHAVKTELLNDLVDFKPSSEVLRILLYGPIGAGKSCFINSVQRVLLGRNFIGVLENSTCIGKSFSVSMKTYKLKKQGEEYYPFEFIDTMGFEPKESKGIEAKDIKKILQGHILDGYTFNPGKAIPDDDQKYNKNPSLCDKVHCVVCILPADSVTRMDNSIFDKLGTIRKKATELEIPQVIILTKVDTVCEVINNDVTKMYWSRKIQEKVKVCSNKLGIPLNSIYAVKNYHAEVTQDEEIDTFILMALRDIVNFANDYVQCLKRTAAE